jgi:hypothetical protein
LVPACLGKKQDVITKITRAKSAGGMAQMVGHQPRKHKPLSSNPNTAKKEVNVFLEKASSDQHHNTHYGLNSGVCESLTAYLNNTHERI